MTMKMIHTAVLAALASAESPKGGNAGAAVQNTTKAEDTALSDGRTLGDVMKDIDKKDLKVAYNSIEAAYTIQYGKDGISDTEEKLKGLQGKIGEHVYAIAKVAMEHCEDRLAIARSYFLALCSQAETKQENWYAGKYKETKPIGQLIPLWSQYKSRIAKGMEKGLDPNELIEDTDAPKYATAAQYSTAVQKMEAEARATGSQAGNTRTDGQVATGLTTITSGWSPRVKAAMEVMCKALNALDHESQDRFADAIMDIANEATTLKNSQKAGDSAPKSGDIVSDSSGKVTGTTRSDETTDEAVDPGTQAALQAALDKDAGTPKSGKRRGARAA